MYVKRLLLSHDACHKHRPPLSTGPQSRPRTGMPSRGLIVVHIRPPSAFCNGQAVLGRGEGGVPIDAASPSRKRLTTWRVFT